MVLNYTNFEKTKIREIIATITELGKQKKLNNYTVNKCLGYAYFMIGERGLSLNYFNKAIELFPNEKRDAYFSPSECYDAIATIHFQQSDTINFKKALQSKIAVEPKKINTINALTQLAFLSYLENDLPNAETYCKEIRTIDANNFDALRLCCLISVFLKSLKLCRGFTAKVQNPI
jgi:tetratricopeptide (TPR) repeat protein